MTSPSVLQSGRRARRLAREVLVVALLVVVYDAVRLLAAQDVGGATSAANTLWHVERWLHLPDERHVQALVLALPDYVIDVANRYYAFVHFPFTIAVGVWLFLRRPVHYLWARRALVAASAVSLVLYLALPVAPPRLMTALGFDDTGLEQGLSVYSHAGTASLSNQYAAMPSLHVGWAVLVAVVLVCATRTHWRWLWLLHPLVTLGVVIVTANHYWLDAAVGTAVVAVSLELTRGALTAGGAGVLRTSDGPGS